jgi:predicted RNA-binding Zn ribbon-like protein
VTALRLPVELAAWAQAAADLVNTQPRATDPPEKLVGLAELEALLASVPEPAPETGEGDVAAMRRLRSRLVPAFEAPTVEALADVLNPVLAQRATSWEMAPATRGGWALAPVGPDSLAGWFGVRAARALAELALAYGVDRLHLCSADDCLRAVVDISRNGTRRYCSRVCATRMNVRRHRHAR